MARSTRCLILVVLVAALLAWWASRRHGTAREVERKAESAPALHSGTEGARTRPSLPDEAPARDETPLAEDRLLGTATPSRPTSEVPPPEPPRASVDPEEPAPDDPSDFERPSDAER